MKRASLPLQRHVGFWQILLQKSVDNFGEQ